MSLLFMTVFPAPRTGCGTQAAPKDLPPRRHLRFVWVQKVRRELGDAPNSIPFTAKSGRVALAI